MTTVVAIAGAAALAWSGIYNVAASRDHWPFTRTVLEFALRSSIRTHSLGIEAPPLDDIDLVRLGGGHFASGCAPCHGAPGDPVNPLVEHMLPSPPPLSEAVGEWSAPKLFWIVKHGLKYTGMPAWTAKDRDDEVWAVVAFLQRLPALDADEYRNLANLREQGRPAPAAPRFGRAMDIGVACARCHGDESAPPTSRLVPKLAGQSARYLALSLKNYAAGVRPSGIMEQVAARLDDDEINELAAYYSALVPRDAATAGKSPPGRLARGRMIAEAGVPAEGVPPCLACHGGDARASFPRLAGQHARYMIGQMQLWKNGLRDRTVAGAIMAPIARRLTNEQVEDVAAYFESLSGDQRARSNAEGRQPPVSP